VLRHGNADFATPALQAAQHFDGFVCRDPTRDAESHAASGDFLLDLFVGHLEIKM
jgi:hypothetical protein